MKLRTTFKDFYYRDQTKEEKAANKKMLKELNAKNNIQIYNERKYDQKTDSYITEVKEINHKLEWENESEILSQQTFRKELK